MRSEVKYEIVSVQDKTELEKASRNEIVIYNANESGPLTFEIAFSGAATLAAAAGVAATALAMTF